METAFRRYLHGRFDQDNLMNFTDNLAKFLRKYNLYVDVMSNYAENKSYGLRDYKHLVVNYDPEKDKTGFLSLRNHYICLKVEDRETLERLLKAGKGYLVFQFRICDGESGAISEEEAKFFETKEEISEKLFDDPRIIAVIKDKWDCMGLQIVYREDIQKEYEGLLQNIANLTSQTWPTN